MLTSCPLTLSTTNTSYHSKGKKHANTTTSKQAAHIRCYLDFRLLTVNAVLVFLKRSLPIVHLRDEEEGDLVSKTLSRISLALWPILCQ